MKLNISPIVSIIVPVYNVEKYITKCIQSLLGQTYTSFEAIIVDDGSVDNSIKIAKELVGNDPRFIFLEKKNGGLSSARNFGLEHVTGDYIAFLDSDDYLAVDCFEKVMGYFICDKELDVILFGYNWIDENHNMIGRFMPDLDQYLSKQDILLAEEYINYSVWSKIYRKEIWHNQSFVEGLLYEDKEIIPALLYKRKLHVIGEHLYFYLQRSGSIMNSYSRQKSVSSVLYIYDKYLEFLASEQLYEQYKYYYEKSYIKFCFYRQVSMLLSFSDSYVQDGKYLMKQLDSNMVTNKKIIRSFGICSKVTLSLLAFKASPILVKFLYVIQQKIKLVVKFNQ